MTTRGNTRKLFELRAKTDRQLITLIARTLDRGIASAYRGFARDAARAREEASSLLRTLPEGNADERVNIEVRLAHLRELVDAPPIVLSACS
jgi:hypothetical protein